MSSVGVCLVRVCLRKRTEPHMWGSVLGHRPQSSRPTLHWRVVRHEAPWRAADLHLALLGKPFTNSDPRVIREDVRTERAAAFGRSGHYLFSQTDVLDELKRFVGDMRAG